MAGLAPGDFTPDLRALLAADIIIATPEKWDGISRNWQTRAYVKQVGRVLPALGAEPRCAARCRLLAVQVSLMVIDEIHLLGADR